MKILGIETSCDETAVSIIEADKNDKIKVLANIVSSQVKLHAEFGGVVPSLAAREHAKNIRHVFDAAVKEAGVKDIKKEIDLFAVTKGPGLSPALLIGINFAKNLAEQYDKPLAGVNHLEGHIYSNWVKDEMPKKIFPALNLIVSGGHTELVLMKDYNSYKKIGETMDDAVGEAFDKVARLLDLGYPGGPVISKLALTGNPEHYPLPSPMIHAKNFDFSYSGLKTAVLYLLRDKIKNPTEQDKADVCASFQKAALEVLLKKTIKAAMEFGAKTVMLSGGVSANKALRDALKERAEKVGLNYSQPEMAYTTDNAVMIATAAYFNQKKKKKSQSLNWSLIEMDANLSF